MRIFGPKGNGPHEMVKSNLINFGGAPGNDAGGQASYLLDRSAGATRNLRC